MKMTEVNFDDVNGEWVYAGRGKNGKPKFKRPTNQTLEHVKQYLDEKGLAYLVVESATMMFIYKDAVPLSRYAPRYSYYYTTGRWGSDKRNKHYHSNSIEHFIDTYFVSTAEANKYWQNKREADEHS